MLRHPKQSILIFICFLLSCKDSNYMSPNIVLKRSDRNFLEESKSHFTKDQNGFHLLERI